jgi:hypothetical protein
MLYRRVSLALLTATVLALWGCSSGGPNFVAKHEPWRDQEDQSCNASGILRASASGLRSRTALGGPSQCGAAKPFEMSSALGGRVALRPTALLRCPMIPQVERWVANTVAPMARLHLGSEVVEITVAASYACRPINHVSGAKLSEHGYANALDVSAFTLADGRKISVKGGWHGGSREGAFLRATHRGACQEFTTVLGPEFDRNHHDHFHFDLARHGRDGIHRSCR